jgi:hypothetical protein
MSKRDTQELALIFHTTVEEVRKAKAADAAENIAKRVSSAPVLEEEHSAAWYCRVRTEGIKHGFTFNGERYCYLREENCRCHRQNGTGAKKCSYKRR